MQTLSLPTYHIEIGEIGDYQRSWLKAQGFAGLAVITDENTLAHCWPLLAPVMGDLVNGIITIPPGEQHKTLTTCQHIWEELFKLGAGRNWCVLNLGGGVIGDMGGFCAGTYKRGIDFIQIPTTLLSQVDASVGGKLGIDFYGVKNSIGLFRDPRAVWADARFFNTLSEREVRSGFAEIIKHALIADQEQWADLQQLEDLHGVNWNEWVGRSVAVKQQVVEEDPFEKGLRKALNFGHTIGHAIESYFLETTAPLLHGEAIAAGMICEAWLSAQQTGLASADLEYITDYFIGHYGHQMVPEAAWPTLVTTMQQDKKNEDTRINVSLLPKPGAVMVNQVATEEAIFESLQYYNSLGSKG